MLMRLLHLLPPEDAHALTIKALQLGLGPTLQNNSDISISLFGKIIRNPIGLSGGADKEASALAGWSKMGFGLVEAGTVTLHPRTGNPQPRMWRLPNSSVINWLGLPGQGLPNFLKNLAEFQHHPARKKLCVGASIASPDGVLDEFKILAEAVAPYVDYITLNASCPNVSHDDHEAKDCDDSPASLRERSPAAFEQIETAAAQIKKTKEGAGQIPVLIKLGPTHDSYALSRMVKAALDAGINGFVATNTVPYANKNLLKEINFEWPTHDGKSDDRRSASLRERSPHKNNGASEQTRVGGYSGKQLLELSCWMVSEIRKLIPRSMPIIGVGGVQSGEDAKRLMESGANAIQLYTGLIYKGPALINEIAASLAVAK